MFVSVIVPVYNAEKTLPRCIESVCAQSFSDWELILLDDGSTDNSAAVCNQYAAQDARIRVLCDSNHGVSYTRNKGICNAHGDYLFFLDADDWVSADAFDQLHRLLTVQEADIVFTAFYKEYKTGSELVNLGTSADFDPYNTRLLGTVWGKLYRRAFLGQHRFHESLHLCEDAELNYRLLPLANKMLYCEYATYHYVYYGNSAVRSYQQERIGQYISALERIHAHTCNSAEKVAASATAFTCNVFSVIVMNNLFSSGNKSPLKTKFRQLAELTEQEPFQTALHRVSAGQISRQQYLLIKLCRRRFYLGVWVLSVLNHLRNKRLNY